MLVIVSVMYRSLSFKVHDSSMVIIIKILQLLGMMHELPNKENFLKSYIAMCKLLVVLCGCNTVPTLHLLGHSSEPFSLHILPAQNCRFTIL